MRPLQKIKVTTNLKKLNILHIATHTKVTRGGSVQLLRLIRGLKERGHNVFCALSVGKDGKPVQETFDLLSNEKIGCFFFNMHKLSSKILLRRIIKAIEFDIIHTHRDLALIFLLQSTLGMKCPAIIANRGTTYPLHFPYLKWFAHRSKRVNKIVAVSQAVKESLIKSTHIKPEKIEVIYGGVDLDEFNYTIDGKSIREEFKISFDAPLIGLIAEMHPKKGHKYFLEASKIVLQQFPDARFILVGGGKLKPITDYAKELGIDKNTIFTDFRVDIPQILAAIDISVCSSTHGEGLTGTLRESLAMMKPTISTDVSGNSEIIIDKKTGLLVPPKDSQSLAEAIIFMIKNKDIAQKMAKNGYELVKENFQNKDRVYKIEKLYYKILDVTRDLSRSYTAT